MGRGRQKAKNMKVARKLKYFSPETDFNSLQRELSTAEQSDDSPQDSNDEDEYWDDSPSAGWRYSAWEEDEEED
ncbi:DUF3073 domain-containing protein [Actinomycetaceae bacterium MB13-C1-2]|nr:DUF3073 domain-containing protein [Actinomycetaceae bacterium MB13-C1-2]